MAFQPEYDRYYVDPAIHQLEHEFWLREPTLYKEWTRVRRFREGAQVVLFDGVQHERLYTMTHIERDAVHLELVTDFDRKLPTRHVYLFWAGLGGAADKRVVQQATELGVTNFVPLLTGEDPAPEFDQAAARAVAIAAATQAGRSDLPHIRGPITIAEMLKEYAGDVRLLTADAQPLEPPRPKGATAGPAPRQLGKPVGIIVGPDRGWGEPELALLKKAKVGKLTLSHLNLRSETAVIAAAAKLLIN